MKSPSLTRQDSLQTDASEAENIDSSVDQQVSDIEYVLGRFSDVAMLAADWF